MVLKLRAVLVAVGLALGCSQAAYAAGDTNPGAICVAGLVPDKIKLQSQGNLNQAFRDAFCGTWNTDHNSDSGGTLNIGFDGVDIDAGGHSNSRAVSRTQFCSDKSLSTTTNYQIRYWSSTVDAETRRRFFSCVVDVQNKQPDGSPNPLQVKATPAGDSVVVSVSWNRNSGLPAPAFGDIQSENVTCRPSGTMRRGTRLPPTTSPADLSCRWDNDLATNGYVVVSTTTGRSQHAGFERPEIRLGTASVVTTHTEQRVVASVETCSPPAPTPPLHNKPVQAYYMTIPAARPPVSWRLVRAECLVDNDGACRWNGIRPPPGSGDGVTVIENTPDHLKVLRPVGSLSMTIRACATEDQLQQVAVPVAGPEQPILRSTNISYLVASGQTAAIHYKAENGAVSDIPVGTSSSPFFLVKSTDVPGGRAYTYLLREIAPLPAPIATVGGPLRAGSRPAAAR